MIDRFFGSANSLVISVVSAQLLKTTSADEKTFGKNQEKPHGGGGIPSPPPPLYVSGFP